MKLTLESHVYPVQWPEVCALTVAVVIVGAVAWIRYVRARAREQASAEDS